jgi:dipeptidyl aminopeptidase/acylaminoacyl peptidase
MRTAFACTLLGALAIACGPTKEPAPPPPPPTGAVPRVGLEAFDGGAVTGSTADGSARATNAGGAKGYSGLGAESLSPELLAKYAPTPLPAEVSRRIQSMLDIRAASAGVLSPDGKTMYIGWSITGTQQVYRLDGPKSFPVQLTGGEDVTRLAAQSPDGKWLVLHRDRKGEENPGIYLLSPKGGALRLVSHKPKVQSRVEFVSDDSKYVYYTSNEARPDSYALYRYAIDGGGTETVFDQEGLWSVEDHAADGRLLLSKATGELSAELYEWDEAKKTLTPILGQGEKEELSGFYGAASGELVVTMRKNPDATPGEFRRVYRYVVKDKRLVPVSPDVKMDARAGYDRVKKHVNVNFNDGGYDRTRVYDTATWQELPLPKFEGAEHVWTSGAKRDGKSIVFNVGTSTGPTRSYVYEWATRKLTEWTVPSSPEIDTQSFAKAQLETFTARDGKEVPMFVRRPKGCERGAGGGARTTPCPVVVQFHGGPEGQATPGFSPYAQLFIDAGFVFVEPNVRGSDGYGRTYLHADDGPKRLSIITDIEDVSKFIRANWAENGRAPKVGVLGGSYGGYSTLVAMTMFAGAYDAGVSIVGISNLVTFLENTAPYRRILRISEYGDPTKDRDALVKLSPITYVDRLSAPLLLIQGASDPRVPVGEAVQMHDALAARGVDTRLIIFPDEGHGAQKRENRVIQAGAALDFFEVHLKGKSRALAK